MAFRVVESQAIPRTSVWENLESYFFVVPDGSGGWVFGWPRVDSVGDTRKLIRYWTQPGTPTTLSSQTDSNYVYSSGGYVSSWPTIVKSDTMVVPAIQLPGTGTTDYGIIRTFPGNTGTSSLSFYYPVPDRYGAFTGEDGHRYYWVSNSYFFGGTYLQVWDADSSFAAVCTAYWTGTSTNNVEVQEVLHRADGSFIVFAQRASGNSSYSGFYERRNATTALVHIDTLNPASDAIYNTYSPARTHFVNMKSAAGGSYSTLLDNDLNVVTDLLPAVTSFYSNTIPITFKGRVCLLYNNGNIVGVGDDGSIVSLPITDFPLYVNGIKYVEVTPSGQIQAWVINGSYCYSLLIDGAFTNPPVRLKQRDDLTTYDESPRIMSLDQNSRSVFQSNRIGWRMTYE